MTIFVLTKANNVLKLDLDQKTHDSIESSFIEAEKRFMSGSTSLEYDPLYKLETDQYFVIDGFHDAYGILDSVKTSRKLDKWMLHSDIKAIFAGIHGDSGPRALIQYFDQRQIIDNSRTLWQIGKDDSFMSMPESFGITISKEIVAVLDEKSLKFRNPLYTDRILDLSKYQQEATHDDIVEFSNMPNIHIDNIKDFENSLTKPERVKLSKIKSSGVLDSYTAVGLCKVAAGLGITIQTTEDMQKIVIPNDRKSRKEILEVLNEDRFTGPLSAQIMLTNSKVRVKTST